MKQQYNTVIDIIRGTEAGTYLYGVYYRIVQQDCVPDFDRFLAFYGWAMASGFVPGMRLQRLEVDKPHSPANCRFITLPAPEQNAADKKRECEWNKAVNRIRVRYGLEPFPEEV